MKLKNRIKWMLMASVLLLFLSVSFSYAESFEERFAKGASSFGVQAGYGYTIDIPPGRDRTDIGFLFFFPNYQYNLTGLIGESWYQGAWSWHAETGVALDLNHDQEVSLGFSPLMLEYKFLNPKRGWAPNILGGAGFSYTDWDSIADRELAGEFQFLLHLGTGIEFFLDQGSVSLNYRFFHISNAGFKRPNVGLNSHVISLGMRF
jgi:hypothetical protein